MTWKSTVVIILFHFIDINAYCNLSRDIGYKQIFFLNVWLSTQMLFRLITIHNNSNLGNLVVIGIISWEIHIAFNCRNLLIRGGKLLFKYCRWYAGWLRIQILTEKGNSKVYSSHLHLYMNHAEQKLIKLIIFTGSKHHDATQRTKLNVLRFFLSNEYTKFPPKNTNFFFSCVSTLYSLCICMSAHGVYKRQNH